MRADEITVNNLKCKIIFLITGMKHIELKAIPREYKRELDQLMKKLQEYISQKEYDNFFSDILEIPLQGPIEEAEDIIKNIYKNRGLNNGRD